MGDLSGLYGELQQHFSKAELVELGTLIGMNIGMVGHLIHSWNL